MFFLMIIYHICNSTLCVGAQSTSTHPAANKNGRDKHLGSQGPSMRQITNKIGGSSLREKSLVYIPPTSTQQQHFSSSGVSFLFIIIIIIVLNATE
jgi:hypothetical protein